MGDVVKKRDASVEALRCFLMFLIVMHHVFIRGPWSYNQALWALPFTCLIAWHVDGFTAISGWFGINFTWRKFFRLWCLMAYYTLFNAVMGYIVFDMPFTAKSFVISGGWYGETYLALMLLSPFLNAGVNALSEKGEVGRVWLLFALMITLSWAPLHFMSAVSPRGAGQFSLLTMVFVYVSARIVRIKMDVPLPARKLILGPVFFFTAILVIGGLKVLLGYIRAEHNPCCAAAWEWLSYYDAPHVWVMAISILLMFAWYIKPYAWLGRCCCLFGPTMFSVYLLHESAWGEVAVYKFQKLLHSYFAVHPSVIVVLSAIIVFICCVAIDMPRRFVVRMIDRMRRG